MLRKLAPRLGFAFLAIAAAPATLQPGKWEVTKHPAAIPLPHALDTEAAEAFRAAMTAPETTQVCLKKRDLAALKPLFVQGGQKSCAASNLTLAKGKVSASAQCVESGKAFVATVSGAYTATTFEYSVERTTFGLDKPGTIAMTSTARRIGGC